MMSSTLSRLLGRGERRLIRVRVIAGGHEVDSFETSSSETLRSAIRPIYAHLPLLDASVRFDGVEAEGGARRAPRVTDLPGLSAALGYLGAQADLELATEKPQPVRRRDKVSLH